MRTAVISDVHSNIEALSAVFSELDRTGIERIICLGDLVGYGADPEDCVNLIKEKCDVVIRGNHDNAVSGPEDYNSFNPETIQKTAGLVIHHISKSINSP